MQLLPHLMIPSYHDILGTIPSRVFFILHFVLFWGFLPVPIVIMHHFYHTLYNYNVIYNWYTVQQKSSAENFVSLKPEVM
jgi:hypothetical protein